MMRKPEETGSQGHAAEKYRRAFLLTLIAFIAVAGVAGWLWWRSPFNPMTRRRQPAVAASPESETSQPTTEPTASADGSLRRSPTHRLLRSNCLHSACKALV